MNKTTKRILIAVVIIFIVFVLYYFLVPKSKPASDATLAVSSGLPANVPSGNTDVTKDTAFLSTLLSLNNIKIDTVLFENISFKNLKDNTVGIVGDGIIGRPNPFAPFEQGISDTSTVVPPMSNTSVPPLNSTNPPPVSTTPFTPTQ